MAVRKFTPEGRFECGLGEVVKTKNFCFVAVVGRTFPWELGVAIADEQGYNPVPSHWCHATEGTDMEAFQKHVDKVNRAEKIDKKEEAAIDASTMGGRSYAENMSSLR